jgi:hypothetical protein
MFKDARARRAWNLYFLKAEAVLSPLAAGVRRELIADLKAHVQDILSNEPLEGDEHARLSAALERVGNPKEFLAPLVADAVFKATPTFGGLSMTTRTLSLYAARGTMYALRAFGLVLIAAAGVCFALASLNSFFRPTSAGLFQLRGDEIQLRVLGLGATGGQQLLEPWMAAILVAIGIALILFAAWRVKRMLLELIAQAA